MAAGRRDRSREPTQQGERVEVDGDRAVSKGPAQLDPNQTAAEQLEPLLGERFALWHGRLAVTFCAVLAGLLELGQGVARDPARARALYRRACDGGYAPACAKAR